MRATSMLETPPVRLRTYEFGVTPSRPSNGSELKIQQTSSTRTKVRHCPFSGPGWMGPIGRPYVSRY